LPDVHTNNLFVERVSEPERFDHRILKYKWSKLFKYNLVKKARVLQKIGLDFGVEHTSSSAAFWAIYRISRLIENGTQKQADYVTRYFTLLAASGALKQANWGALICHREGLINDGLSDAEYPSLERIAYYQSADGFLNQYERYPSFYAMQTVNKFLTGARYLSTISSANGLEIHHFTTPSAHVHIAWTINGKVAYLADIYSKNSLNNATIMDRDGETLSTNVELICEKPIFLCWDVGFNIETKPQPKLAKNLAIHAHIEGLQYFTYTINGWSGLILAKDKTEADMLKQALNPNLLEAPQKNQSLRHARNVIWTITDPRDPNAKLTVKQPIKMYPHKAFLDRFKPSKAKRSWNGAMELLRRGVNTAQPIAYFEKVGDSTLKQNFYFCEHVNADCSIGEMFSAFSRGESIYKELIPEEVYQQFAAFTHHMHSRGIYFRDYSGGNILISIKNDKQLEFSLIDTARLRSINHSLSLKLRTADLTRACHKLHPAGRKRFMQIYLGLGGRKFNLFTQLRF
jgi:Lipopolysaccharide kinase (Kdo/WaaP) family